MKKPGTAPDLLVRDWVPIEVQNLAVLSTGHARGLRLGGSPGSPAAFERSGCALVWNRKEYGLINATCGLGGPHYATIALQSPRANFRSGLIGYATLAVIGLNR